MEVRPSSVNTAERSAVTSGRPGVGEHPPVHSCYSLIGLDDLLVSFRPDEEPCWRTGAKFNSLKEAYFKFPFASS